MAQTKTDTDTLADRLDVLADAVTKGRAGINREFYMSIPAQPGHDADLVLAESGRRLRELEDHVERLSKFAPVQGIELRDLEWLDGQANAGVGDNPAKPKPSESESHQPQTEYLTPKSGAAASRRVEWHRADPAELAKFDPRTKVCNMNCGPHRDDPRSNAERRFLCEDCHRVGQRRND